ncbi:hypothetical protein EVAR_62186_1 [Eumeta japonica]|uniref:Uncharacterized protein n=1 Tax=Eumeta variegata TaxID=151549 RepID=A0A4C1Z4K7_EUMVA|nr:hypothetical protein EVAR_62186_1 [Eumeta japonica]
MLIALASFSVQIRAVTDSRIEIAHRTRNRIQSRDRDRNQKWVRVRNRVFAQNYNQEQNPSKKQHRDRNLKLDRDRKSNRNLLTSTPDSESKAEPRLESNEIVIKNTTEARIENDIVMGS